MLHRASGVLLHPTSLPTGNLESAPAFLDFLKNAGQTYWQVLPLNPPGAGLSPYSSDSAFAGNPALISAQWLINDGLLTKGQAAEPLKETWEEFKRSATPARKSEWDQYKAKNQFWLKSHALFYALKAHHKGAPWTKWEEGLRRREPAAVESWSRRLEDECDYHSFVQFLFDGQWQGLRQLAGQMGIQFIGDLPLYVSHDSADVWAHQDFFRLDGAGEPLFVAGVPPDYFSETGQRWGNPLYDWAALKGAGYGWWIKRVERLLEQVDILRIDHFIGLSAYWEIPAKEKSAVVGRWVPGPGRDLFDALKGSLKKLPFVAENLGILTPESEKLRLRYKMPGMRILQFSFPPDHAPSHPYNFDYNTVVYTGTHDNDTVVGWFQNPANAKERDFCLKYLDSDGRDIHWQLIRLAMSSPCRACVIPLQDILGKGGEARMNFPGKADGNWRWRYEAREITPDIAARLRHFTDVFGRARKK